MAKKKPKKKAKKPSDQLADEESRDELLALNAIFGDAIDVREDEGGFSLRVVPHPGEAEANHVAVTLIVSYPRNYPKEELVLKLSEPLGLADADVKALSKQLHQTAATHAREGEICCFQLVTLCQEFLQARNAPPPEAGEPPPPPPESLWHEMQLRERSAETDAADVDFSMRASGFLGGDAWGFGDIGGSLFAEAADPVWSAPAVPASPPVQVAAAALARPAKKPKSPKPAAARQLGTLGEPTAATLALGPGDRTATAAAAASSMAAAVQPASAEATQAVHPSETVAAAAAGQAGQAAESTAAAAAGGGGGAAVAAAGEAGAEPAAEAPSVRRSPSGVPSPFAAPPPSPSAGAAAAAGAAGGEGSRAGALVDPTANPASMSRVNSMLTAVKQSISAVGKAVLPRLLRRQLDGQHSESASEAGESTAGVPENEAEREQIRRELLLGHLLTLAAAGSQAAVPPHALPAVAAMLQAQGLLPKWVGWTLTQQPALFDRAFQRLFAQEMKAGRRGSRGGGGSEEDPSVSWAIDRFWQRRPAALAASRSLSALRSKSLGPARDAPSLPASRYETDFAEIRQLGRGGYGVVMAAVNRMDGRQYAIKKIPLDIHSPHAYARIMREVTTLSRLQHPNVVRYYQAWVENTLAAGAGQGGSDSELSDWGSGSFTSSQPSSPRPGTAAAAAAAKPPAATAPVTVPARGGGLGPGGGVGAARRPAAGLYPLSENSKEGRASSPSQLAASLPSQVDGYDTSEPSAASSTAWGLGAAGSGAGAGGNLAVADGARLLASSAHGSRSQLTAASDDTNGAAWQSAHGASSSSSSEEETSSDDESGSGSEEEESEATSSEEDGDEGEESGGLEPSTTNSAFTFERSSRPSGTGSGGGAEDGGAAGRRRGSRGTGGTGTGAYSSSQPSRRGKGASPRLRQVLFIQMEYCPRTLRDVLDSGPLDETDRWRVLRQILAGLAHIHAQGIIHRDLKPANIFYDAKGDIKLGDFGLAKFNATGTDGELPSAPAAPAAPAGGAGSKPGLSGTVGLSEATGVCGTSYYISPEIANSWASYDEKVDLYSLGVVAFELWHPFSTGMERVVLLRDLRENDVMPADFEAANPVVCRVIRWLMAANPAQRPTAKEVLRSDLLPATVGDEQLRDLLRSLPDNPATYDRVVDAVFNLGRGGAEAAGQEEAAGAPAPVQMAARDHIVDCVKEVFGRHGAVPMCSLDLGFATPEDPKGAMQVLSPSGVKLALRYEMRQPFAAWVVHQVAKGGSGGILVDGFRRYELAWVQRRVAGQAGLPRSYLQADLDFILPAARTPAEQLLGEAEVMSAVHDVLLELPECGHLEIRIGHRQLFELALQYVGVSRELRGSVAQLLSTASAASPLHAQARSKRWPSIRAGLEGLGLGQEAIGRCRQLVLQGAGEAEAALFRLRAYLSQGAHTAAAGASARRHGAAHPLACLDEIQSLIPYLTAWGLPGGQLVVDPLVPPHADYFSGALFQFHSLQEANGATAVVAVGGRYDNLLKLSWARQAGLSGLTGPMPAMGAVGATINVERLVALAAASARWRRPLQGLAGLAKLSQADVLVCSRGGGGLLRERMALVRSLWDAGVAAEMLHAAAPSLTEQYEYARVRGIPWLVIIQGSTFSAADTVRVKHLERRLEEDVAVADVARYLQQAEGAGAGRQAPLLSLRPEGEGEHGEGVEDERSVHGGRAERERERRRGRDKR